MIPSIRRKNLASSYLSFDKLLAVYVDEDIDDNENVLGYDLIGGGVGVWGIVNLLEGCGSPVATSAA